MTNATRKVWLLAEVLMKMCASFLKLIGTSKLACKMQKYARCKIMQVKVNPIFCNDLSAEGAIPDVYYRGKVQLCLGLSAGGAKAAAYFRPV